MNQVSSLFMMGLLCISGFQLQSAASFHFSPEERARLRLINKVRAAMDSGNWDLAKELIEQSDDLSQYAKDVFLQRAVQHKQLALVKLLVDKGADIINKDDTGKSAMDYADEVGDQDIIEYLESYLGSKFVAPAA
jgi:hypothetical protein